MEKEKKKPIRVCMVMGKWIGGGVESVIMNYYRHIDREKIQFDFVCDEDSTEIPYDEIKKLGGRVIICPSYTKVFEYQKFLIKLFKENRYKIVHSNINALSVFPLRAAKKAGVPIRIAHSHSTSNPTEWKKNLAKNILRPLSRKYANVFFACSEYAARWLFGDKLVDAGKVTIIRNAINVQKFKFNAAKRKEIRKELGISDSTLVIGHVGRFVKQKNHVFLINLFNKIHRERPDSKLILIGTGPLEGRIKRKVEGLGLEGDVIFLGQRGNVADYYNAMDVFVLPSLYEGLGMVLVEAQANGLRCVASTEVPEAADVGGNVKFVGLFDMKKFKKETLKAAKERKDCSEKIRKNGYDINNEANKLTDSYERAGV